MPRKRLFLIDGMSCAYRAFYAIRDLRASSGQPTNAVYGFTTMLMKIIRERKPDALAVAFDSSTPTFRHERFGAYKAQRKPMPDDLKAQLPVIREILQAYGIAGLQMDGVEADDLMGSVAARAEKEGYDVFIVTSDKDLLQLVGEHVVVVKPDAGEVLDRDSVVRRYGVGPERIIDVFALSGDPTDNVPGVPGIGEKTAIELVKEYGGLDEILENVGKIKGKKRRESIELFADQARLSRELVTVRKDLSVGVAVGDLLMKEPDRSRVSELFRRLEFKRLYEEFAGRGDSAAGRYGCVNDLSALSELADKLGRIGVVSMNVETTDMDPMSAEPVGISFSFREGEGFYVPMNGAIPPAEVVEKLRPVLQGGSVKKVGQNLKDDMLVLGNAGVRLGGILFDAVIAAYLLNPAQTAYGLADLAREYLGMRVTPISDLTGKGKKKTGMKELPVPMVCSYACEGADMALRLKNVLEPRLKQCEMEKLFHEVEMPLLGVLADMEATGVRLDTPALERFSEELSGMISVIEGEIFDIAGERFNLNSHAQLRVIMFEKLGLPTSRKTRTGYSTDYEVLLGLSRLHPLPAKILEYRQLSKLKSTYVDALPRMVNPRTGRVHTSFSQTGTVTGRLSSSDPNLQNIPVRTEIGRRIREAFIPGDKGMLLLSADYSQIDLRILAHLSGDEDLIEAFRKGDDIHSRTASAVFGVEPSGVTAEMRRRAKTINFGIIYGMSAYGLSRELGIEADEAADFIKRYFDCYRGVRLYIERCLKEAAERGYVTTILNRRRSVPELASPSSSTRDFGQRIAVNTPVQGSSADLIKIAMITIAGRIRQEGWRAAMLIQIHDELLFEVDRARADDFGRMVKEEMEGAWRFSVPLKVDIRKGNNWGEL